MNEELIQINEKTFLHLIKTENFKSSVIATFLLTELDKEKATMNALIPAVLRRGTNNYKTMKDIAIKTEEMYGAIFDASIDKIGDNQAIEFYLSSIDDAYALNNENLLKEGLNFICDVIFNPLTKNGVFDTEYVSQEKETLKDIIRSKINDKATYAINRCVEEMFEGDAYSIYKYGDENDLEKINPQNLYKQYKYLLNTAEIHFYVSGNIDKKDITKFFEEKFEKDNISTFDKIRTQKSNLNINENPKNIVETMDVTQGKLVLGYDVDVKLNKEDLYKMLVYNAILRIICKFKIVSKC